MVYLIILPGIEVSAGNKNRKNVHLIIINPKRFYFGKGDGPEVSLDKKPDNSVSEILKNLDPTELGLAAHPFRKIFFLEKWLLKRGSWSSEDLNEKNLAGLQPEIIHQIPSLVIARRRPKGRRRSNRRSDNIGPYGVSVETPLKRGSVFM